MKGVTNLSPMTCTKVKKESMNLNNVIVVTRRLRIYHISYCIDKEIEKV